jgi:diacylglycerol kinase family enzyme
MRVRAIINKRGGGALGLSAKDLARELETAFRENGHEITVELAEPDAIEAKFGEAVASEPDILIAGGGDGTIRSAASHTLGSSIALGILPLGTINRLAHDLHIPVDPTEAIRTLARSGFRKIDVGEVNGRIFLCNSLLGLPPQISEERQHLRGRPLSTRIAGYFGLLKTIVASHRRITLSIDDSKATRRLRALSVAVSNNTYRHRPTLVLTRETLDGGKLGIYVAKHRTGLGLLWVLVRAGLGLWSDDPKLDSFTANRVTIDAKRKSFRLSNDGEVETLETPLHYQIHPKALTVSAPPVRPA